MPILTLRRRPEAAQSLTRRALAAYRRAPKTETLVALVLVVGVVAAAASSLGHDPIRVALITGALLGTLHVAVHRPSATATCGILAGFACLSPLAASGYLAAMGATDYGVVLNLCVAAIIIALVAHRTSVGRAPFTVAMALAALGILGPALTVALPGLGTVNGFVLAGAVLFARSRRWRAPRTAKRDAVADGAATLTDIVLADLPEGYTALRNVTVPRTGHTATHLVIGPSGVTVLASVAQPGIVREHATRGLELDGHPLAPTLSPVLDTARAVGAALDIDPSAVVPVLVMHGTRLTTPHTVVALVGADGHDTGHVHVCAPDSVLPLVHPANPDLATTDTKTVATLVKRARKFRRPKGTNNTPGPASVTRSVTVLDDTGLPKTFTEPGDPQPMFRSTSVDSTVLVGQAVSLMTDQGTFAGYRSTSAPRPDDEGTIVVEVCSEQEWRAAQTESREAQSFPYPLASVTST